MNKIITILFILISMIGITSATTEENPIVNVKYTGFSDITNTENVNIHISGFISGKLVYLENYYSIDSFGKPKFYSSLRHEENNYNGETLSFNLQRPADRYGVSYTFVETKIFTIYNNDVIERNFGWVDLRN